MFESLIKKNIELIVNQSCSLYWGGFIIESIKITIVIIKYGKRYCRPNIRAIAKVNFQESGIEWYGVRKERRHPTGKAVMKEYDVILATSA